MKRLLHIPCLLLAGCFTIPVPVKVGVCKDDVCVNFELPATVQESGKEVVPVQ